jgi:Protein of unknown function (DUF3619)
VKYSNTTPHLNEALALESRFAYRLVARLSDGAAQVEPDVAERLRFARDKALERARLARASVSVPALASAGAGGGTVSDGSGWWIKLASALPLVALAAGLLLIEHWQSNAQIAAAAEIDANLLADDLPPGAYSDPGFVEFLKTPRD